MYDISLKNIKKGIGFYSIFFFIGLFFGIFVIIPSFQTKEPLISLILIFPVVFLLVGGIGIINIFKRIKKVKRLNQVGKLYKNIPYTLVPSGMSVNNNQIMKPVAKFKLPNGSLISLEGDPRHDFVKGDSDGYIDLVLDPDDYSNYFLDYDINRIGGNRSDDYYKSIDELNREEQNQVGSKKTYEYPKGFTFGNYDGSNDGRPYKPL